MEKKLPGNIVWRKDKVGFEPPQQQWLQHIHTTEYLHEQKRKLVQNGILNRSVLSKPVTPLEVHEAGNFNWRYLCAGAFT